LTGSVCRTRNAANGAVDPYMHIYTSRYVMYSMYFYYSLVIFFVGNV
jgi:hypothetical protein